MQTTEPRLPNFLILGAGRCGTTTLYHLLREHPDIFLCDPKEPSFFCRPFHVVGDPISYVELFTDAGDATAVGEASHVYLSHPDAARTLRAFFPLVRFLVILRNPADRAYSLYSYMTRHGYEIHGTFEKALAAEERRATDPDFGAKAGHYEGNFMYFRSGLFGQQLQRYFKQFPSSAFHLTTLSQLSTNLNETLAGIHNFLNVRAVPAVGEIKTNEGRGVRSASVQTLARRALERPSQLGIPWADRVLRRIHDLNMRSTALPMNPSTRTKLLQLYSDDLALLERLTGLDVSS